ncbi:hypothetical protein PT974_06420 [Cladobotryum mycophilum]|uniref:Uncharacterized protein n=1 Tax=Cladobotryum mycophilum TaxID=491253 RepID=A0ABR0SLF1_9HYPO
MHFTKFFLTAATAGLALAGPIQTPTEEAVEVVADKRDSRTIFFTSKKGWGGAKAFFPAQNGQTYNWGDVKWPNNLFTGPGSVGPPEGVCCDFSSNQIGVGNTRICFRGSDDTTGPFQFHIKGFRCFW